MQMFMIACHLDYNKNVVGFRIIDTDSGEVKDYNYESVKAVLEKGIVIDGIKIDNNELKGSNGAFVRYTQLINGVTVGTCPVVIVKEYPNKFYDVCNHLGQIVRMSVEDIIKFASVEGLANGKIVSSDSGKYISSISGEYPKDRSFREIEYGDKTRSKMKMLGVYNIEFDENNRVYGVSDEASNIVVGRGCLGVKDRGFAGYKNIKSIILPNTCTELGVGAFLNCSNLVEINIPEGVKIIPRMCFQGCSSLETIILPNSIRKIEAGAFKDCTKLREASLGPVRPEMNQLSFPRHTKMKIRR